VPALTPFFSAAPIHNLETRAYLVSYQAPSQGMEKNNEAAMAHFAVDFSGQ
jgi:hypothetical protein